MKMSLKGILAVSLLIACMSACAGIKQKKASHQKSADAYYQLGANSLGSGDYQNALLELRRALSLRPDEARIHNAMGLVYFYTERHEQAEASYRKAISLDKAFSESYVNLGTLYARQEKYTEAIKQFRKALENPFYRTPVLSLHNIGLCYQAMGKTDDAEAVFREAVQQNPDFIRGYFDLGKLYYGENRMEEAIQILNQAIQKHSSSENDPKNSQSLAHLHYWLGLSYFKNGDSVNAVTHFQQVTRLSSHGKLSEEAWKYLDLLQ